MQGRSGISQIEKFDTNGYSTRFAGEIKQLDVTKYVNRKMARRLDDVIKYTIVAGKKVCTVVLADHTHILARALAHSLMHSHFMLSA